ncbi:MAG: thermonuclease family protein [Xanthobacteraceae bacterium]|nr:MAG: thermonuclease family protein [Xanthobacteraceae bacterium]
MVLDDGRELLLSGIEPALPPSAGHLAAQPLAGLATGRMVAFVAAGKDVAPDRHGRFPVWAWVDGTGQPLQHDLVAAGAALANGLPAGASTPPDCARMLLEAEKIARQAKMGLWRGGSAIKNAESPGEIVPLVGRFAIVEGRVRSVRAAGATLYVNFGRRWIAGFAVPVSRRTMGILEAAGLRPRTWEKRRIRVRGWVELRGGPRIAVTRPEQVEVLE